MKRALQLPLFTLLVCIVMLAGLAADVRAASSGVEVADALARLPVQDGGRLKPYDTFAREALQLVYGKQTFEGRPAAEIVMTWMLAPQLWENKKIIQIQHGGLKEALRLPKEEKLFAPGEIYKNDRVGLVFQELQAKRETKEKLNPYFQAIQRLESQLGVFQEIVNARSPGLVPPKEGTRWLSVAEMQGELQDAFIVVTKGFIGSLPQVKEARSAGDAVPNLTEAVARFTSLARAQNPQAYADNEAIDTEVHYNNLHPFMWTWIFYLLAAGMFAVAWGTDNRHIYRFGWAFTIAAFLIHTYGFGLRVYLSGRPPVSNMYESVVWVGWGAILFAMIFEYLNKRAYILLAGAIVGVLCLITADMAPAVLDRSIQPLEPVLRSTLWLTVHVLTITISYAAFFVAWAMGLLGLGFIFKGDKATSDRVRGISQSVYRMVQVGVVLLAAGTILGGVWADYSWGRFWGWDPKETWAFIALLGYLALLHARLVGWVRNFGMMAGAVIAASLVIMAWYGVNYVLGAGLHSYGFGAGGVEYVAGFLLLQLVYVSYVAYIHWTAEKAASSAVLDKADGDSSLVRARAVNK